MTERDIGMSIVMLLDRQQNGIEAMMHDVSNNKITIFAGDDKFVIEVRKDDEM